MQYLKRSCEAHSKKHANCHQWVSLFAISHQSMMKVSYQTSFKIVRNDCEAINWITAPSEWRGQSFAFLLLHVETRSKAENGIDLRKQKESLVATIWLSKELHCVTDCKKDVNRVLNRQSCFTGFLATWDGFYTEHRILQKKHIRRIWEENKKDIRRI